MAHRDTYFFDSAFDRPPGQVGFRLGDRQRPVSHAAMAHLIPIGRRVQDRVVLFPERRFQSLFENCGTDRSPRRFGQFRIEPVVTDRQGGGHFGHIQKVGRIPVRE